MKISPLAIAQAQAQAQHLKPAPSKLEDAAAQFEAIFVKQLLSSLERTADTSSGSKVYGSMVVDSMADAITRAGGLGLAQEIQRALEAQQPKPADKT